MKSISSAHEIAIMLTGIQMMIFGSIFTPLVSSSKNLNRPALDAGNGALFFLLSAMPSIGCRKMKIKTFLI
jgi:hypothetical protein